MPLGVLSGVPDIITHTKFDVSWLRGFSAAAPLKVSFPILIRTTLTTVLHYRADCDCSPGCTSESLSSLDDVCGCLYAVDDRSDHIRPSLVTASFVDGCCRTGLLLSSFSEHAQF